MLRELIALDNSSKVWIYQADREFTYDELDEIRELLFPFVDEWSSHGSNVPAYANVFHRRFLCFFADESQFSGVSGCSIDSSVAFVKKIGEKYNVNFFDRMQYAYMEDEDIRTVHNNKLNEAKESGEIKDETLFFDNLVSTKEKFLKQWLVPLQDSWHKRML